MFVSPICGKNPDTLQGPNPAFQSPPCRDDGVQSSVGSTAVGGCQASVGNVFVSPPVRDEHLPTLLTNRECQNVHRAEPTTWQGYEARRLTGVLTATGREEIARELWEEFDRTVDGEMCPQALRQYSNIADAPTRKRGEVGYCEDEQTTSPNRNTRSATRNAGSSSSNWAKRRPDADRVKELEDNNTTKPVAKSMRECKHGCGSSFMVRGEKRGTPPVEEIQNMREDLCTHNRNELRTMLYDFLRHEGGGRGQEVPASATKDGCVDKTFTVKTEFFAAKLCFPCMAALFVVISLPL